eukprot:1160794-Pelagomonas_calceolata.AAC.3
MDHSCMDLEQDETGIVSRPPNKELNVTKTPRGELLTRKGTPYFGSTCSIMLQTGTAKPASSALPMVSLKPAPSVCTHWQVLRYGLKA